MRYLTSIRGRLLLLVLLSALPAMALVYDTAAKTRELGIANARVRLQGIARLSALDLAASIHTSRELAYALGENQAIQHLQEPACSAALGRALRRTSHFLNLLVIDRNRRVVCSGLPILEVDGGNWPYLDDAFANGEALVTRPVFAPIAKKVGLPVAIPVESDDDGGARAVIVGLLDLSGFGDALTRSHVIADMVFTLWDTEGTILFRYPDSEAWAGQHLPNAPLVKAVLAHGAEGSLEIAGLDGVSRIIGFAPLQASRDAALYLSVGVPKDQLLAHSDALFTRTLAVLAALAALALTAAWLLGHRLIWRQVRVLADAAGRFGAGEFEVRVGQPYWRGELGELARAFDGMAEAFRRHVDEIRQSKKRIQAFNADLERRVNERTAQLEASKNEIEDLYNNAPCGYHSLDSDGVFVRINDTELSWLGYRREELLGIKRFTDIITPESIALFRERFPVFKEKGLLVDAEFDLVRRDGTLLPVSLSATAVRDAGGGFLMSRSTVFDITERRAAEHALHERERMKSEFLANMSHELRTPLNAVIGFSEALQKGMTGELTSLQQEFVSDILASGEHLLALINDILDLSKVEAGMMTLALEPVDLADLIHTGLSVVREKAQARGIHLHGEVDTQGLRMQVDARKCKQILYNLLANAVKFTPDGGQVRVRARRVERAAVERPLTPGWSGFRLPLPASAAESFVEIVIADTGIGMPAGKLDTLFQPFVQIDSSLGRKYEPKNRS